MVTELLEETNCHFLKFGGLSAQVASVFSSEFRLYAHSRMTSLYVKRFCFHNLFFMHIVLLRLFWIMEWYLGE